jgi:hypothetical protein
MMALREPGMRSQVLLDALRQCHAVSDLALDDWVLLFGDVIAAAHDRRLVDSDTQIHASIALDVITMTLASPQMSYQLRRDLHGRAVVLGKPQVARLLFTSIATDAVTTKRIGGLDPERPIKPRDRALSLGERKSLARTPLRESLLLIAKDPHSAVVAVLLDNPRLSEPDVVRIAATRPAMAEALELIANHPKWRLRRAVKRALVWNPYAAIATAVRMMTTLTTADLREIAQSTSIAAPLVAHAKSLLPES